jgi:hypothetical protein
MMTETPDDVTPRKKKPEPSAEAAAAAAELGAAGQGARPVLPDTSKIYCTAGASP